VHHVNGGKAGERDGVKWNEVLTESHERAHQSGNRVVDKVENDHGVDHGQDRHANHHLRGTRTRE
jgi:hypothetical protein